MRVNEIYNQIYLMVEKEPNLADVVAALKGVLATVEHQYAVDYYNTQTQSLANQLLGNGKDEYN